MSASASDDMSADALVEQAVAALRTKDTETASTLLAQAITKDPRNEQAWLWLSGAIPDDAERRYCLEQVLSINPQNTMAQRGIEAMPEGQSVSPSILGTSQQQPNPTDAAATVALPAQPTVQLPEETKPSLPPQGLTAEKSTLASERKLDVSSTMDLPDVVLDDEDDEDDAESPFQRIVAKLPKPWKKKPKRRDPEDEDEDDENDDEEDRVQGNNSLQDDERADDEDDEDEDDEDEDDEDEEEPSLIQRLLANKVRLIVGLATVLIIALAIGIGVVVSSGTGDTMPIAEDEPLESLSSASIITATNELTSDAGLASQDTDSASIITATDELTSDTGLASQDTDDDAESDADAPSDVSEDDADAEDNADADADTEEATEEPIEELNADAPSDDGADNADTQEPPEEPPEEPTEEPTATPLPDPFPPRTPKPDDPAQFAALANYTTPESPSDDEQEPSDDEQEPEVELPPSPDTPTVPPDPNTPIGYVINGGNVRSEQRIAPDTVIGQMCPGDQVSLLEQQAGWYRFRMFKPAEDCHPDRIAVGTEGWSSSNLITEATFQPDTSYPVMPDGLTVAIVNNVVEGDVLDVFIVQEGINARISLRASDTPSVGNIDGTVECFGTQARAKTRELLQNTIFVLLEVDQDVDEEDQETQDDDMLYYVWHPNGMLINLELLQEGVAFHDRSGSLYQGKFGRAELKARQQESGLWSPQTCDGARE